MYKVMLLLLLTVSALATEDFSFIDNLHLPEEHIQYWINRDNTVRNLCFKNEICHLKVCHCYCFVF